MPAFVEPSLALLVDKPPSGPLWVHEIKFDGYRLQARIDDDDIRLLTRKALDWTKRFPPIATALRALGPGSSSDSPAAHRVYGPTGRTHS
jgi:bifunctional non-homologous end joining protein LigD